ncbi:alpha/beta hydrolase family protein [Bacillus sp. B1-b2]|uniref:alpha/beta hydrolase family protein n=1 Tax=Bacillus sp. B1-b2 TaxID=2653201 RepID=UPI001261C32C|nr:alpha/beta fold hydrolase [Bacillus sp. B1-b2]KAB7671285.1 alpha/beta hydrolase [Bacillus sp. B1-b2]
MMETLKLNWKEDKLILSIDYPEPFKQNESYQTIIICHGLIGSRMGVDRLFVKTSHELTKQGFLVVRFDYKGCGESSGEYGTNSLDDLMEQTSKVIEFTLQNLPVKELTLLGHSLGGAVALLTAIEDSRVTRLIQWAAVGKPEEDISKIFGARRMKELRESNRVDFYGYHFYPRYFHSLAEYEPIQVCSKFKGDVFLAHGTNDQDIPYTYINKYRENYHKRVQGSVQDLLIENAEHTFSQSEHFQQLITGTINWLKQKIYHYK